MSDVDIRGRVKAFAADASHYATALTTAALALPLVVWLLPPRQQRVSLQFGCRQPGVCALELRPALRPPAASCCRRCSALLVMAP
jgi:hypothetical protein